MRKLPWPQARQEAQQHPLESYNFTRCRMGVISFSQMPTTYVVTVRIIRSQALYLSNIIQATELRLKKQKHK